MFLPKHLAFAVSGLLVLPSVLAAPPVQKVKPPVSQAMIDLATFSGGMPIPGGGAGFSTPFGMTQAQSPGRWMDVVLLTRNNGKLKTATHSVPAGSKLAPVLNLLGQRLVRAGNGHARRRRERCRRHGDGLLDLERIARYGHGLGELPAEWRDQQMAKGKGAAASRGDRMPASAQGIVKEAVTRGVVDALTRGLFGR